MNNGGSAVDAVEIAIKVLEDREITNSGYGSNLGLGGVVECDAIIVDHNGTSGAAGAVAREFSKNKSGYAWTNTDVHQRSRTQCAWQDSFSIIPPSCCPSGACLQTCSSAKAQRILPWSIV